MRISRNELVTIGAAYPSGPLGQGHAYTKCGAPEATIFSKDAFGTLSCHFISQGHGIYCWFLSIPTAEKHGYPGGF